MGSGTAGVSKVNVSKAVVADQARGQKERVGDPAHDYPPHNAETVVTPSPEGVAEAGPADKSTTYTYPYSGDDRGATVPQQRPSVQAETAPLPLGPDARNLKSIQTDVKPKPVVPQNRPIDNVDMKG